MEIDKSLQRVYRYANLKYQNIVGILHFSFTGIIRIYDNDIVIFFVQQIHK